MVLADDIENGEEMDVLARTIEFPAVLVMAK